MAASRVRQRSQLCAWVKTKEQFGGAVATAPYRAWLAINVNVSQPASGSNLTFPSRAGIPAADWTSGVRVPRWKSLSVSSADAGRLRSVVFDRDAPQKHIRRAKIVLFRPGDKASARTRS